MTPDITPPGFDYLGGPYYHARTEIRAARFEALTDIAAWMVAAGRIVFSPITHSHPMHIIGTGHQGDHDFWMAFDGAFMRAAKGLIVAKLPGWEMSKGLRHEREFFEAAGKPIVELDDLDQMLSADLWTRLLDGAEPNERSGLNKPLRWRGLGK